MMSTGRRFGQASRSSDCSRRCVAPVLGRLAPRYERLSVSLDLNDRVVDIAGEGSIWRSGSGPADNSSIVRRLSRNRWVLVATPAYLDRAGRSASPAEMPGHEFLRYGEISSFAATPRLQVDNGQTVLDGRWRDSGSRSSPSSMWWKNWPAAGSNAFCRTGMAAKRRSWCCFPARDMCRSRRESCWMRLFR